MFNFSCSVHLIFFQDEMVGRYERIKVIATDEIRQNFSSPKLLLKLILEIHHEVNYYNASYKQAFSRLALYTSVLHSCVVSWWPDGLLHSTPDWAVWVKVLAGDIVLCTWARHTPLFCQLTSKGTHYSVIGIIKKCGYTRTLYMSSINLKYPLDTGIPQRFLLCNSNLLYVRRSRGV